MEVNLILFFLTNIVTCAFIVTTTFQPISATLALAFAFINASFIFLTMNFEFIALIFLIVYVGAIIILFLFSVLLLHLKHERSVQSVSDSNYKASLCFFLLNYALIFFLLFFSENSIIEEVFYYNPDNFLTFFGGAKIEIANNYLSAKNSQNFEALKQFWLSFKYNTISLKNNMVFFETLFDPFQNPGFALTNVENVKSFNIGEIDRTLDSVISNILEKKEYAVDLTEPLMVSLNLLINFKNNANFFFSENEVFDLDFWNTLNQKNVGWNEISEYSFRNFPKFWTFFNLKEAPSDSLHLINDYVSLQQNLLAKDSFILNSECNKWDLLFIDNNLSLNSFAIIEGILDSELEAIGLVLYTQGCVYFLLVSILLLVALIGSVVLINTNTTGLVEYQNTANQMSKKPSILFFN
jgi:NADH:ubiquinone oxidoreductase subunit 6 (subunit J)